MLSGQARHPWGPRFLGGGTLGPPHGDPGLQEPPPDPTLEAHLKRLVVAMEEPGVQRAPRCSGGTRAPMETQVSCQ